MGLEGRLSLRKIARDDWGSELHAWSRLKATHITIDTSGLGLRDVDEHLALLAQIRTDFSKRVPWDR